MAAGTVLLILTTLPFIGSLTVAFLRSDARNAAAWISGAVTLASALLTLTLFPKVSGNVVLSRKIEWIAPLGLELHLRMDGFAWMFAMLITAIGVLVVLYARYYMSPSDPVPRFFSFLLAFMGAMLGVVLSGNLIQLVLFWELTSLFSFLLIGYWHQNAVARDGARMALTVTAIGGLCLFVGVLLIGAMAGSYDLDQVLASGSAIRSSNLYVPALILIVIGAMTKSAQFPFHFWLPHAMAAPTPVSAYLHSATMVKAGVFLLARLWPVMAGTDIYFTIVVSAGLATLVAGAYGALFQHDLKGVLAYSTISHLGLITLLLGLGSSLAAIAAVFHMMNHAIFKASLFMAAGIIDHETGTRDIRRLSGLARYMPITATLAMVAAAAMAGVPLLNGFLSKEMFFAEALADHVGTTLDNALPYIATLAGAFAVAYSLRFICDVFFGPPPEDLPRTPHEPPHWMRFPVELLVLTCLVVGIAPTYTVGPILAVSARAVVGVELPPYSLAIWHGFSLPLLMSIVALIAGTTLYVLLRGYLARSPQGPPLTRFLAKQRLFENILVVLSWRWARTLESFFSTQRLQPQLRILVAVAILAAAWPILRHGLFAGPLTLTRVNPAIVVLWVVGMASAIAAAVLAKYHRVAALAALGGTGLVTCITFAWLSAPDLAVTQLLVEIVTTVLLLLGLRWLPKRISETSTKRLSFGALTRRTRDFILSITAGLGMAAFAYAIMTRPLPASISSLFVQHAYTDGGGHNVVNVILVDFRGFDTFGEITVLGVVALTVFALLRRFRPAAESEGVPEQQRLQDAYDDAHERRQAGDTASDYLLVPGVIMHWLFPVIGVFAAYLFLRGHDLPGGGFAAGVTMSIAFILQYIAGGTRWVEDRLRILPVRWIGAGLLCAALTGAGALVFGYPFLTSYSRYVDLPLLGKIPLATAVLFDLGVFLLVVGATVLVLIALAHQSIRRPRASRTGRAPRPAEKAPSETEAAAQGSV